MTMVVTPMALEQEKAVCRGTGGVTSENTSSGFRPTFFDPLARVIYPPSFADGRPAPFHLLDGLPQSLVLARDAAGGVTRVRSGVISGFVRAGRFYTRDDAAWQVNVELSGALLADRWLVQRAA